MDWPFIVRGLTIGLLDLVLSGDNGVVIALAVKSLPQKQRVRAIAFGAAGAVLCQVTVAFFATQLINVRFIRLVGGLAILWIAVNLLCESEEEHTAAAPAPSFWRAIRFIVVADLTMSVDNVLAVAAVANGSLALLALGLSMSIPLVIFASSFLAKLMDKYKAIVYLGAAILGAVAANMILTDTFVAGVWQPGSILHYGIQGVAALGVLGAGKLLSDRNCAAAERAAKPR